MKSCRQGNFSGGSWQVCYDSLEGEVHINEARCRERTAEKQEKDWLSFGPINPQFSNALIKCMKAACF